MEHYTKETIRQAEEGFAYGSFKNYVHSIGLSACFRQHRAQSHCRFMHGYSLQVEFEFTTSSLDERNWVVDFGSLKSLRGWLENMFDHKTLVAEDDPEMATFELMAQRNLIQMVIVPSTGCESFARIIYDFAVGWLSDNGYTGISLKKVTVREHGANGAYYEKVSA